MRFDDRHEVVVTGPWTDEMVQAVVSGVADRVVLNHALGFQEPDLQFLADLPIRELVVLDRRIDDLSPVYSLVSTLQRLDLTVQPGVRVDLSALPHLRSLGADWEQIEDTVTAVPGMSRLALGSYTPADFTPIAALRGLDVLTMKDRPRLRSLNGLTELPLLGHLGVYLASELSDVSDLAGRDLLRRIDLQACRRLRTIDDLRGCTGLRILNIAEGGDLDSAAPLGALLELEELYAYGGTRFVDGDLSAIAALPRLTELRVQGRRHYRPTVADLKAAMRRRAGG